MEIPNIQNKKTTLYLSLLAILIVVIGLQTLHFNKFYLQPLSISIVWSIVDWSIWFLLFYFSIIQWKLRIEEDRVKSYIFVFGFILLIPFVQVILSTIVFKLVYGLSRPFIDDVIHLVAKRWYQNLFISGSLFILFNYLKQKILNEEITKSSLNTTSNSKIIFNDGKTIYNLIPDEIQWLESAKNYVVVRIAEKQILVRSTLKSIEEKLTTKQFLRVSRSVIINTNNIYALEKEDKNNLIIITKHKDQFKVGKTYQKEISELIETGNLHPA